MQRDRNIVNPAIWRRRKPDRRGVLQRAGWIAAAMAFPRVPAFAAEDVSP